MANGVLQQLASRIQMFLNSMGEAGYLGISFFGSWLLMFLIGPAMIRWLRQKRWRKDVVSDAEAWQVREDTPETHQKKQGTPSMGGIGLIGVACLVHAGLVLTIFGIRAVATGGWSVEMTLILLSVLTLPLAVGAHAVLGFADDWSKASGRGGLRARAKLFGQVGLGFTFLLALYGVISLKVPGLRGQWGVSPVFAGAKDDPFILVFSFIVLCLVLIATGNAVNLTDGIDGLAAGLAIQTGFAFLLLLLPEWEFGKIAVYFWTALAGSCLGFLAYNKHKAQVFMGDTGSLAIGAALGAAAIMTHSVFLLPFIGFIYFVEMFSVTFQVAYFKYTKKKYGEGRRIFRRAPLHHHFELGGWSEWRVVGTFWGVNLVMACLGLILWHLKILPRFP